MPAASIDEYLSGVAPDKRVLLEELRALIAAAAPDAVEAISYGMPAFTWRGKGVVCFAAFTNHCSLFPLSGGVLERFADELAGFRTSKGTLQFTAEHRIPDDLVRRIVATRLAEIEARIR